MTDKEIQDKITLEENWNLIEEIVEKNSQNIKDIFEEIVSELAFGLRTNNSGLQVIDIYDLELALKKELQDELEGIFKEVD